MTFNHIQDLFRQFLLSASFNQIEDNTMYY